MIVRLIMWILQIFKITVLIAALYAIPTTYNIQDYDEIHTTFDEVAEVYRAEYYNVTKHAKIWDTKITLHLPGFEGIAGVCLLLTNQVMITGPSFINSDFNYLELRQLFFHEFEHCAADVWEHSDGVVQMPNGKSCPISVMSSTQFGFSALENCYRPYKGLYDLAMIKGTSIDKFLLLCYSNNNEQEDLCLRSLK